MIPSFYAGQEIQVTITFTNLAGTPTDPTGATLTYRNLTYPATTTVSLASLTKTSTGLYTLLIDTTAMTSGSWYLQVVSTGAVAAVAVTQFTIEARPI